MYIIHTCIYYVNVVPICVNVDSPTPTPLHPPPVFVMAHAPDCYKGLLMSSLTCSSCILTFVQYVLTTLIHITLIACSIPKPCNDDLSVWIPCDHVHVHFDSCTYYCNWCVDS